MKSSPNQRILWSVVAALLVASVAYTVNLNAVSFWEDESWLAIAISGSPADLWTFAAERGVHPPLYFYLAYVAQFFIGTSELALRWFGGLTMLVGIAVTYRLGADVISKRAGMFAAWLAAGSMFLMYYARLARQYPLFFTLSALMGWLYWRWRTNPHDRRWWLALAVCQAALLWTHYFGGFMAIAIGLHALVTFGVKGWRRTLSLAAALLLGGVLFAPWIPSILVQMGGEYGSGLEYGVPDVPRVLSNYTGRVTNDNLWLGGVLTLLGILALARRRQWSQGLLLLTWIVGTFIPVLIVNQTLFMWYIGRNMMYTLPAVVLLYGAGLAYISRHRLGRMAAIAAVIVFGGWGAYVYSAYFPGTADWRSVMQRIARDARPSDTFVLDGEPYSTTYYLQRYMDADFSLDDIHDMQTWQWQPQLDDDSHERVWLIDSGQAVNFEAIDALPAGVKQTRRIVRLPIVAEFYQPVPDERLVTYDDQLALGYTDSRDLTAHAGETLTLDMWWQALRPPTFNYSVGVFIVGESGVLAEQQGNFDGGRMDAQVLPVGEWIPDTRSLTLPPETPAGAYRVLVTVYDWRDGTRLPTTPDADDNLFPLATLTIN